MSLRSRSALRAVAVTIALVAILITPAAAGRIRQLGLGEMTERAGMVFDGTCTERRVVEPSEGDRPYTTYTFVVHDGLKGVTEQSVVFSVSGAPGRGFAGMPTFEVGQRALLLLYPPGPRGLTSPMGLDQGVFHARTAPDGSVELSNGRIGHGLLRDVPDRVAARHGLVADTRSTLSLDALAATLRALIDTPERR